MMFNKHAKLAFFHGFVSPMKNKIQLAVKNFLTNVLTWFFRSDQDFEADTRPAQFAGCSMWSVNDQACRFASLGYSVCQVMPSVAHPWTPLTCDSNTVIFFGGAFQADKKNETSRRRSVNEIKKRISEAALRLSLTMSRF